MVKRRSISILLLVGLLTVGNGSAAIAEEEGSRHTSEAGSLTLEVAGLIGMDGLELAGALWEGPTALVHVLIDEPVFEASDRATLAPGHHYVWVFAGEPPCEAVFIPACGLDNEHADYFCWFELDVLPGDDYVIRLEGLPRFESETDGRVEACPVTKLSHLAESTGEARGDP